MNLIYKSLISDTDLFKGVDLSKVYVSPMLEEVKKKFKLPSRVYVFDTTLRDGEQTPGTCFTLQEKIEIASKLDELGVDVIELGFPVNSPEEEESVRVIASQGLRAKTCGLARCVKRDIDVCIDTNVDRVHVFIAASDIHLKYKLKISAEKALEYAVNSVEYVKSYGVECEFSCEDATRTSIDRLIKFYKAVVEAGADVINVPDTVGVIDPNGMFELIRRLGEEVKAPISIHCHNDFGLAVANTIAGVLAGARQVHVTVNGLGERAGNASLEQVVTALSLMYGVKMNVKLNMLTPVSKLIQKYSMINVPPNYPIVGENAFSHEAGIHVHGVLERAACYEPFSPELVGQQRRIVLGKHTGRHAVSSFIKAHYGEIPEDKLNEIVNRVKEVGARKKKVVEDDVLAIADEVLGKYYEGREKIRLDEIVVVTGNKITPMASIQLLIDGDKRVSAGVGVGPVDAAANAIQRAIGERIRLLNYKLEAISGGTDSLASVEVLVDDTAGARARGTAVSGDIVMASVKALIEGINRLYVRRESLRRLGEGRV